MIRRYCVSKICDYLTEQQGDLKQMSAYLVGHDHIDALLSFAVLSVRGRGTASYYDDKVGQRVYLSTENATEIGRTLLAENERSINARYPDTIANPNDMPGTVGERSANYTFKPWLNVPKPTAILKGCSCFDYQACETEDYSQSTAWKIIDGIRHQAIRSLPDYDEGPGWEFTR